ncbi:hypothetical protein ACJX0J_035073, partial [Zea mays]
MLPWLKDGDMDSSTFVLVIVSPPFIVLKKENITNFARLEITSSGTVITLNLLNVDIIQVDALSFFPSVSIQGEVTNSIL